MGSDQCQKLGKQQRQLFGAGHPRSLRFESGKPFKTIRGTHYKRKSQKRSIAIKWGATSAKNLGSNKDNFLALATHGHLDLKVGNLSRPSGGRITKEKVFRKRYTFSFATHPRSRGQLILLHETSSK